MSTSNASTPDRLSARGFRVPVALAGAAVLGLSLLLSVGPALGAGNNNGNGGNGSSSSGGGNGTSGNVKVHDAGTGVETAGSDNEPHVCDFWLGFTLDAPFEAGIWVVVSWPPTGDGSTVVSGVYDTSGDGIDSSDTFEVPAGHYRVEWAATGATVSKKKTFWVDAECDEPVIPEDVSSAEEAASPVEESPAEQSSGEEASPPPDELPADESAPPADESAPPVEESPAEELVSPVEELVSPVEESQVEQSSGDESPADEPPAGEVVSPVEESPVEEVASPADVPAPPVDEPLDPGDDSDVEQPATPGDQTVAEGDGAPADESAATPGDPSVDEEPAQAVDPGSTEPGTPSMQDQLDGTPTSAEPTMSDTAAATLPVPSGIAATFGLLLLIAVHATARRGRRGEIHA